jgi:hypothetical protein
LHASFKQTRRRAYFRALSFAFTIVSAHKTELGNRNSSDGENYSGKISGAAALRAGARPRSAADAFDRVRRMTRRLWRRASTGQPPDSESVLRLERVPAFDTTERAPPRRAAHHAALAAQEGAAAAAADPQAPRTAQPSPLADFTPTATAAPLPLPLSVAGIDCTPNPSRGAPCPCRRRLLLCDRAAGRRRASSPPPPIPPRAARRRRALPLAVSVWRTALNARRRRGLPPPPRKPSTHTVEIAVWDRSARGLRS